jgi:hypothetical protein
MPDPDAVLGAAIGAVRKGLQSAMARVNMHVAAVPLMIDFPLAVTLVLFKKTVRVIANLTVVSISPADAID